MKDITVIQVVDFWGVYLDGTLVIEDNSPILVKDIISLLDPGDDAIKLSFIDMEGSDLEEKVLEDDGFPEEYPL
jgi:hypothetical protein